MITRVHFTNRVMVARTDQEPVSILAVDALAGWDITLHAQGVCLSDARGAVTVVPFAQVAYWHEQQAEAPAARKGRK